MAAEGGLWRRVHRRGAGLLRCHRRADKPDAAHHSDFDHPCALWPVASTTPCQIWRVARPYLELALGHQCRDRPSCRRARGVRLEPYRARPALRTRGGIPRGAAAVMDRPRELLVLWAVVLETQQCL